MRIDKLTPGTPVTLRFGPDREEAAIFLGVTGHGDDREARFVQADGQGGSYEWSAYRFKGAWCYGTSADRLSLAAVLA